MPRDRVRYAVAWLDTGDPPARRAFRPVRDLYVTEWPRGDGHPALVAGPFSNLADAQAALLDIVGANDPKARSYP